MAIRRAFFRRAQVKIELSIFFREARQPIEIVNFSLRQRRACWQT
jgi:hypothetical protein